MAIYRASNGDVMGKEIPRFGKKQRQEWARAKAEREERELCADPRSVEVKRLASAFQRKVKADLRRLGLCREIKKAVNV